MNFSLPPETPKGQREAITANEKTITVNAGAGTGKTWVLTNRYLRLLIENENISPSDILTLTFTEAAAGEMKQRIEKAIDNEAKNFDEERKNKILDGLSDSWISTIHSFAGRIIRESGLSLDIDPRASVISTQQAEDFWEGIKNALEFANLRELARTFSNGNKILRDTAKNLDEDEYLSAAVNKWKSANLTNLAKSFSEIHSSSDSSWQKMLYLSDEDKLLIESTRPEVVKILLSEWLEVWNLWSKIILPETKTKNPESSGLRLNSLLQWQSENSPEITKNLKDFYDAVVLDKTIKANRFEPFLTLKTILGMTLGDWRKTQPEIIKNVTEKLDAEISPEELRMRRTLMKFCSLSWGMWDMMKQRRGLLSFSDMIVHAKNAIKKNSVTKNFAHILVDEFQDTDPLQYDMITSLRTPESNTALFAVGDPKQSIYKFRHADPSLFANIIQEANKAKANISLDVSFRTREILLNKINKIFSSLWRYGLGKSDLMKGLTYEKLHTPQSPLSKGRCLEETERFSGSMPDFKIILTDTADKTTEEARRILAEDIAFRISNWVKEGRTIWDKTQRKIRPVKFSDFAVLSRSRNVYPVLEEAFNKFNIKSIQDKSTDYFTRGEINDVVCLLRAAADFNDDFSVTGWLMSPFSGVDENEAIEKFLMLIDDKHRPIDIIRENFPEAYSKLEYFALVGEVKGASGILSIFDKNRKWLSCYKINDRLRILRNLRTAVSIAGAFQESGTSTLNACAEYLTRSVKNKIAFEEPRFYDEDENAVKLGVVHAAKGLEYPVTIVFESRVRKNSENRTVRPSKNLGLVFNDLPDEVKKPDLEMKLADWERLLSEQGDIEEEARLFYVAATRAQDSLIFCGLLDKNKNPYKDTWTKFMLDNVNHDEIKFDYAACNTPLSSKADISPLKGETVEGASSISSITSVQLNHEKNYLRQFSASSFALFELCPFAWRRKYKQGLELTWENSEMNVNVDNSENENEFVGGAELGSLAHWILSKWPVNENYESELEYYLNDREVLANLSGNLRRIWRNKNSKTVLKEWLLNFAKSDLGQKLIHQKNIKREYHFRTKLENISLAGAMDAFFDNNVIDYKITSIENAPSELYDSQMDFYALAAHEITKCENVKIITAYLSDNKTIERVCSNFDEIKSRVLKACEICASGICEAKIKNCNLCPFKKGCAKFAGKNY